MNRIMALIAFAVLAGFVGILVIKVPSPDLIAVALLTLGLAAYDLATSSGRK
ncbi:hypothetical protein [Marivita sp. GX14005]|uniref:hypothetical protein n=1 Tax=Marivita sp. GX14005 TaxID=2942276 RepID=UPI0020196CCF|nr:hypothetical protein [Marivita sp. GX14005]MCL3883920.1 hypothetical protein [Marivita sp. GX14005]